MQAKGDLAKRFANPTPMALGSFAIVFTTLTMDLMGFRGASSDSALSIVGAIYYLAGVSLTIAGVMEWILGNTFPMVVFIVFGGFFYSFGTLINPQYAIAQTLGNGDAMAGSASTTYNASIGMYMVMFGVICLVFFIVALRVNMVFAWIFFSLIMAYCILGAAYFKIAEADMMMAGKLVKTAGAFGFCAALGAWYLFFVQMLSVAGYPFDIPVGDLSWFMARKKQELPA